jgi:uncharacterized protein YcfJ
MNFAKRIALGCGSLLLVSGGSLFAGQEPGVRYEEAPVVDVEPIVRVVRVQRPRRECWDETAYEQPAQPSHGYQGYGSRHSGHRASTAGPTIAGGLVGGVIGRQFGSGDGRDAMTLVGTLIGAAVANDRATARNHYRNSGYRNAAYEEERRPVTVERCRVDTESFEEERIEGYNVTYEYHGETYEMRMAEPPRGETIKLRVHATPVRDSDY